MAGRIVAAIVTVLLLTGTLGAQGDPWYRRSTRPKDFVPAKMPWNTIAMELPKDWQVIPGRRSVLFTISEKTRTGVPGGAIVFEQKSLLFPRAAEDVNAELAALEAAEAQEQDPAGTDFTHALKEIDGTRFLFVTYTRPGSVAGAGADSVVQYGFVRGAVIFRIIGIAPATQIARYQPIFAHVAATFRDTGLASP
jgi:hypothetical protein